MDSKMNERIKELARQVEACYIPRYDMWQMDSETMKKFAELIVRECARVYWNIDDSEIHGEYVKALKKHFGVES
jgi:hypothetical protein